MVDLLLVDELFIVANVVEDAGDAHELEFRFDLIHAELSSTGLSWIKLWGHF